MVTPSRHLSDRVSEGCSQRTDWNKEKPSLDNDVTCKCTNLGQTWLAWAHSYWTDIKQCWWCWWCWWCWRDDMGDVSSVSFRSQLRSWHSRRPGRQPPSVCREFQTEPTACLVYSSWGPEKHNYPPNLFWLLSCSQKYKEKNIWCFEGDRALLSTSVRRSN